MRNLEKELAEAQAQAERANDTLRQIPSKVEVSLMLSMAEVVEARALRLTIEKAAEDIKIEIYRVREELRLQRQP